MCGRPGVCRAKMQRALRELQTAAETALNETGSLHRPADETRLSAALRDVQTALTNVLVWNDRRKEEQPFEPAPLPPGGTLPREPVPEVVHDN